MFIDLGMESGCVSRLTGSTWVTLLGSSVSRKHWMEIILAQCAYKVSREFRSATEDNLMRQPELGWYRRQGLMGVLHGVDFSD